MYSGKMSDYEWISMLIKSVEARPGLYDKKHQQYSKQELWAEVCKQVVVNWDHLTQAEKSVKSTEIQHKWQNLRTCFKREVNKMSLEPTKKKRQYLYFDQMRFLLPHVEGWEAAEVKREPEDFQQEDLPESQCSFSDRMLVSTSCDAGQQDPLRYTEDVDEDKMFLLSLLPSLRRLPHHQKLEAKIQFLNVLKHLSNKD